jgi:hypothetical protein
LSVLDTTALSPGVTVAPSGLRVAANGKAIVMLTNATAHGDQAVEVDLTTSAERIRSDARWPIAFAQDWSTILGRNSDRSRIYVLGNGCTGWYASSTDTFTSCGSGIFTEYGGMTFDASGQRLTRGATVYDRDVHALWDVYPIANVGPDAAISPDGSTVFLGAGPSLTTARLADRTMLSRTPLPLRVERLFVAPNGTWLLAFHNTNGSRVTRVDLQ